MVVHIDVWGTCISRDALCIGGEDEGFEICNYIQECNFDIQFTKHVLPINPNLSDYKFTSTHKSVQQWYCSDFNKDIVRRLNNSLADWIILDARPFAYGTVRIQTETGLYEFFTKTMLNKHMKLINENVKLHEVNYDDPSLLERLDQFTDWLLARYGHNIILIESVENSILLDNSQSTSILQNDMNFVEKECFFNHYIYKKTNCWVIHYPFTISDINHKWNVDPVHHVSEYYEYVYSCIVAITSKDSILANRI